MRDIEIISGIDLEHRIKLMNRETKRALCPKWSTGFRLASSSGKTNFLTDQFLYLGFKSGIHLYGYVTIEAHVTSEFVELAMTNSQLITPDMLQDNEYKLTAGMIIKPELNIPVVYSIRMNVWLLAYEEIN